MPNGNQACVYRGQMVESLTSRAGGYETALAEMTAIPFNAFVHGGAKHKKGAIRMTPFRDQIFEVSSIGKLYRKSLEMFGDCLEDENGNQIHLDDLAVGQSFFVIFQSGTGLTRTSAVRVA